MTKLNLNTSPQNIWENYLRKKIYYSKHDMIQTMTLLKKWERKIIPHVGVEDIANNGKVIISIYICWGFNTKEKFHMIHHPMNLFNYQWWSINGKKLILWKLNHNWMKILNDIACNLNWIELKKINLNLNKLKEIWLKRIGMQISEESIENLLVNMVLEQPIYLKT
jgi:hypothetical protein